MHNHRLQRGRKRLLRDIETFSRYAIRRSLRPYQVEPARAILDSVRHHRGPRSRIFLRRA